jgi:tellurite resistance protein
MQRQIDALLSHFPAGDEGLIAVVDLTVLIAIADGQIDGAEMTALEESIEAMVGGRLSASLVGHLVTESRAQIRALGPDECARAVGSMLAARDAAEDGVALALAVAWASEGLSAPELDRITQVAEAAGIEPGRLDELIAEGSGPVASG